MELHVKQLIVQFSKISIWNSFQDHGNCLSISFVMKSGTKQTVFISENQNIIEFSIASLALCENVLDIPESIKLFLKKKNTILYYGKWSIFEMSFQYVYTLVHQCCANELSLQIFQNIISCLINECDELDQIVLVQQPVSSYQKQIVL